MRCYRISTVLIIGLCLVGDVLRAGTSYVSGETKDSYRWHRFQNIPPAPAGAFAANVPYDPVAFSVSKDGAYVLEIVNAVPITFDTVLCLYESRFAPSDATYAGAIAYNDDMSTSTRFSRIDGNDGGTPHLKAGKVYIAVVTGYAETEQGQFTMRLSGPGRIRIVRPGNDLDADGLSDYGVYAGGKWTIYQSIQGPRAFGFGTPQHLPFTVGLGSDRATDVGVYNPSTGDTKLFWQEVGLQQDTLPAGGVPISGDFDGDTRGDYGVYVNGMWTLKYSMHANTVQFNFGSAAHLPFVGDFDGDGLDDVGVYAPANGRVYRFIQGVGLRQMTLPAGGVPVVADFDGDWRDDWGVYVAGNWTVRYTSVGIVTFNFGSAGHRPFVGQFTYDLLADVGVYNPTTGKTFMFVQGVGLWETTLPAGAIVLGTHGAH